MWPKVQSVISLLLIHGAGKAKGLRNAASTAGFLGLWVSTDHCDIEHVENGLFGNGLDGHCRCNFWADELSMIIYSMLGSGRFK